MNWGVLFNCYEIIFLLVISNFDLFWPVCFLSYFCPSLFLYIPINRPSFTNTHASTTRTSITISSTSSTVLLVLVVLLVLLVLPSKINSSNYEVYGAEAAGILARAWCHKMQWHLNAERRGWPSSSSCSSLAAPAPALGYVEPLELAALVEQGPSARVLRRVDQIRALCAS